MHMLHIISYKKYCTLSVQFFIVEFHFPVTRSLFYLLYCTIGDITSPTLFKQINQRRTNYIPPPPLDKLGAVPNRSKQVISYKTLSIP